MERLWDEKEHKEKREVGNWELKQYEVLSFVSCSLMFFCFHF